jgi:Uma2 family endonuclease
MSQPLRNPVGLLEYLAIETSSDRRHEYLGGEIHAMTGGTARHNRVAGNIYAAFLQRFDGTPCQVFINDMKLHVQAADCVYYPDVFVTCGRAIDDTQTVATDATIVVEVQSESTASTDRREKLVAYRKLPGLRAYWIVSQHEQKVEVHRRDDTLQWIAEAYAAGEALPLLRDVPPLPLAHLYAGTELA